MQNYDYATNTAEEFLLKFVQKIAKPLQQLNISHYMLVNHIITFAEGNVMFLPWPVCPLD